MTEKASKVAKLRAQRDELNNRIQRELVREQREQREHQERRVQLVGEAILEQVEEGHWPKERLLALMDKRLTKTRDRAVFGLAPLEPGNKSEEIQGVAEGEAVRSSAVQDQAHGTD